MQQNNKLRTVLGVNMQYTHTFHEHCRQLINSVKNQKHIVEFNCCWTLFL